jgi:hypothetical protein
VRYSLPGQQVGVVFDIQVEYFAASRDTARQQVQGVGGVAGEDDQVIGPPAHKRTQDVA